MKTKWFFLPCLFFLVGGPAQACPMGVEACVFGQAFGRPFAPVFQPLLIGFQNPPVEPFGLGPAWKIAFFWRSVKKYYKLRGYAQAGILLRSIREGLSKFSALLHQEAGLDGWVLPDGERLRAVDLDIMAVLIDLGQQNYIGAKAKWADLNSQTLATDGQRVLAWPSDAVPYSVTKAQVLSTLLPGLGMAYVGEWGYGLLAFGINTFLISNMVRTYQQRSYALSVSFLFFEVPFYLGNIQATKEMAEKHNRQRAEASFQTFILPLEQLLF